MIALLSSPVFGQSGDDYVADLEKNHGKRLIFVTPEAEDIVSSFNIGCKTEDGRYVPLRNLLLARLKETDSSKITVTTKVDNRGADIRIIDVVKDMDKILMEDIVMEINQWGELIPLTITTEAILNTCFGAYGPIWVGGPK